MEFIRRNHQLTLLTLLAVALLLGGCASGGIFGNRDDKTSDNGGYDNGDYDRSDNDTSDNDTYDRSNGRISEVRGSVDRVDTADRIVWVEASGVYRNNLRNTNDDKIALHYDDQTRVEYEGKTYEPSALEEGDRIVADVDDTGSRLYARDIEVTYDVTQSDQNDRSAGSNDSSDDRYDRTDDRKEVSQLRGTVRWVDQDRRVMELENTSWGFGSNRDRANRDDVVQVYYDGNTVVEYNGKRYEPSSLERGDQVEIDLRTASGSRYTADEIQVVQNVRD